MRTLTTANKGVLKIFASAKEMPANRYTLFQKFLLMESGIGSSMEAVNLHFNKLHTFLAQGMNSDAIKEAENLHFNFFSIMNEVNYQSLAFACMVHSINDVVITDISEENLKLIVTQVGEMGVSVTTIEEESDEVKKKS